MRIDINSSDNTCYFDDIKMGGCFLHGNVHYQKVNHDGGYYGNRLTDGIIQSFRCTDRVIPVALKVVRDD